MSLIREIEQRNTPATGAAVFCLWREFIGDMRDEDLAIVGVQAAKRIVCMKIYRDVEGQRKGLFVLRMSRIFGVDERTVRRWVEELERRAVV